MVQIPYIIPSVRSRAAPHYQISTIQYNIRLFFFSKWDKEKDINSLTRVQVRFYHQINLCQASKNTFHFVRFFYFGIADEELKMIKYKWPYLLEIAFLGFRVTCAWTEDRHKDILVEQGSTTWVTPGRLLEIQNLGSTPGHWIRICILTSSPKDSFAQQSLRHCLITLFVIVKNWK